MREKAKEMWILGELISVTAQDEGGSSEGE